MTCFKIKDCIQQEAWALLLYAVFYTLSCLDGYDTEVFQKSFIISASSFGLSVLASCPAFLIIFKLAPFIRLLSCSAAFLLGLSFPRTE